MNDYKNTSLQQNAIMPNNGLSEIELYNSNVLANLKYNSVKLSQDAITQHTVKHFNDRLQRTKLSDVAYNVEVRAFNDTHGFLLPMKVIDKHTVKKVATGQYYNYINYPFISPDAFSQGMKNYRSEVERYHNSIIELNKEIGTYNSKIIPPATDKKKLEVKLFKKDIHKLFVRTYNKKAEAYNEVYGNVIKKRRHQKLGDQLEIYFSILLGFYSSQLKSRNAFKMNASQSTSVLKTAVPTLKLRFDNLVKHKIDGIPRTNICKKTAQNRMNRLREVGIIQNYVFRGTNAPIICTISSKILVINDGNIPKRQNTDNKPFKGSIGKELHNNSDTTRTILLKEDKIKELSIDQLIKRNFNSCLADGYKNTQQIVKNQGCEKNKKEETTPEFFKGSENLRALLIPAHILAQQLADNKFLTHTALKKDQLLKEVQRGNLSRDEFITLIIYDFFKIHSKVYKDSNVYAGNYVKAIKEALETWFFDKGFNAPFKKRTVYDRIDEYRWKLNFARKFYIKTKRNNKPVNPLYPHEYFNKTRTLSKEMGFFGLYAFWKEHKIQEEIKTDTVAKTKYEAAKRKRRLTTQHKIEKRIKNHLNNRLSIDDLYNYVQNNFRKEWLATLPKMIKREQEKQLDQELKLTA